MEQDKIEALLEKYWKAETTLEEERVINNYLVRNRPADGFDTETNLFKAVNDFKSVKVKEMNFPLSSHKNNIRKIAPPAILKIAATIMLVISASVWWIDHNRSLNMQHQLAMQHKIEADLFSISNSLNHANLGLNEIVTLKADAKSHNQ